MNIDERVFCTPRELPQFVSCGAEKSPPHSDLPQVQLLSWGNENPIWGRLLHSSVKRDG